MVTQPIHTISLLVRNKPGVLVRVSLVFSRRGYNMESLVVSPALSIAGLDAAPGEFSRMTITCSGDPDTLEQIIKQIEKLVDVVHAIDHTGQAVIESELALVKIQSVSRTGPRSCRSPRTSRPRSSTSAPSP